MDSFYASLERHTLEDLRIRSAEARLGDRVGGIDAVAKAGAARREDCEAHRNRPRMPASCAARNLAARPVTEMAPAPGGFGAILLAASSTTTSPPLASAWQARRAPVSSAPARSSMSSSSASAGLSARAPSRTITRGGAGELTAAFLLERDTRAEYAVKKALAFREPHPIALHAGLTAAGRRRSLPD